MDLWILRRLKALGNEPDDLKDVFMKEVRSVVELAVRAWLLVPWPHPALILRGSTRLPST